MAVLPLSLFQALGLIFTQDLAMQTRLAINLWSSCLNFLSTESTDVKFLTCEVRVLWIRWLRWPSAPFSLFNMIPHPVTFPSPADFLCHPGEHLSLLYQRPSTPGYHHYTTYLSHPEPTSSLGPEKSLKWPLCPEQSLPINAALSVMESCGSKLVQSLHATCLVTEDSPEVSPPSK